ncbi:MAG TPA: response regulator [Ferrovibrio sp.]|uniref:response regulator n=1 Tax=Ferrovibrio sp. TaxID=1917215 RepID=UPI002B4B5C88|nr:response regulator [Ferrovibrio sp.]HLT78719.1 response regulator [Ferrovibrio sp.]
MARILVVEDDTLLALTICDLLEAEGHVTLHAADGEEALAELRRHVPDLIVTDYRMPRMDGEALVNAIRRDPQLARLRVVMVSSYELDHLRARQVAVDAYVQKPYQNAQLVAAVERMIQHGERDPSRMR